MGRDAAHASPHWRSPVEARDAIAAAKSGAIVMLDFDETLFLRNSTEEYLRSITPRWLAVAVLVALNVLRPWLWFPGLPRGEQSRDFVRVYLLTSLFPSASQRWELLAPEIGRQLGNRDIIEALWRSEAREIVVASIGYDFIIRPLLKDMEIGEYRLIACGLETGALDRKRGKLALLDAHLESDWHKRTVFVTDSLEDHATLEKVANAYLTKWPQAQYRSTMDDLYLPFRYMTRVKHPGEKYLAKTVTAEDWMFAILATSWLSSQPIFHAISIAFLTASFWCIYEIGYMENDLVAELLEPDGKLSEAYEHWKGSIDLVKPWVWSFAFALPGLLLLALVEDQGIWWSIALSFFMWVQVLVGVRLVFYLYNRVNKVARVWLYPVLQLFKSFGVLAVTATNLVGASFLVSQVVARWVLYLVYRYAGKWAPIGQIIRLVVFLIILLGLMVANSALATQLLTYQTLFLFGYAALKARREIISVWSGFGMISSDRQAIRAFRD
jgi:hypothetical protein